MPGTRRTPIRRQHTSSIAAALPLYQRARKARAKANHSNSEADRQAAHAAERDCDRLLGIRLWHVSIFDFDDIFGRKAPPAYMGSGKDWHRALELRQQLEEADRELRRRERAARRAKATPPSPPPEQPPSPTL
jgi:hypothetical protein